MGLKVSVNSDSDPSINYVKKSLFCLIQIWPLCMTWTLL